MTKKSKRAKGKGKLGRREATAEPYHDRDLSAVNPLSEQFEPTPDRPVNQHKRMAGMG